MCGFIGRVTDSPHVKALLSILGIDDMSLPGGQFRPRGTLPGIVLQTNGVYQSIDALWWYALTQLDGNWVANPKITSFNARSLNKPLWSDALNSRRCIIFADGFGERHQGSNTQYLFRAQQGIALGGLYKTYSTPQGIVTSVAVITRDPHPRLSNYHEKSCPLFLPPDREFLTKWLSNHPVDDAIAGLLERPKLFYPLEVTPVKTYVRAEPLGDTSFVEID